jgi:hypothetical protein
MLMYNYGDYTNPVNIPYTDAEVTAAAGTGEVSKLNFSVMAKTMRRLGVVIDRDKVFAVNGQYYVPVDISKTDDRLGEIHVECRDLFYEVHYGDICESSQFNFSGAGLAAVMSRFILPPFNLVYVNAAYPAITGEYIFFNRMAAINDIKRRYGGFDIVVDGFDVSVYLDFVRYKDGTAGEGAGSSQGEITLDDEPLSLNMTGNNTPAPFVASASSTYFGSNDVRVQPWRAFDGITSAKAADYDAWGSSNTSFSGGVGNAYLQIDLGEPQKIYRYRLWTRFRSDNYTADARVPSDFTLQGSVDGINFNILDTQTGKTFEGLRTYADYDIAAPGEYRYYRLDITRTAGNGSAGYVAVGQLELFSGTEDITVTPGGGWDENGIFELKKGENCSVIEHTENRDNVLTHIVYQRRDEINAVITVDEEEVTVGRENAPVYRASHEYSGLWPFVREIYVELPDNTPEAYKILVADVLEANKLPIMNYKLELPWPMWGRLNLYDAVKLYYEPLGIDVRFKVMSVTRTLKKGSRDVIEIGNKPKDILEYVSKIGTLAGADGRDGTGWTGGGGGIDPGEPGGPGTGGGDTYNVNAVLLLQPDYDVRLASYTVNSELNLERPNYTVAAANTAIGYNYGTRPDEFYAQGYAVSWGNNGPIAVDAGAGAVTVMQREGSQSAERTLLTRMVVNSQGSVFQYAEPGGNWQGVNGNNPAVTIGRSGIAITPADVTPDVGGDGEITGGILRCQFTVFIEGTFYNGYEGILSVSFGLYGYTWSSVEMDADETLFALNAERRTSGAPFDVTVNWS